MIRSPKEIEAELLAIRCQLGERDALEELVRRWERPLLFYIRKMLPGQEDALGVMQEVWVKVFASLGSLRVRRDYRRGSIR